jgi:serine/threonine-protein kinase
VWFIPLVAWSVGLAIHGLVALSTNEDDWREHDEGMQRWEESRRRRHEMRMAVIEMRTRGDSPRRRIEAAPEPRGNLRVADTGREREREHEREAEAEADLAGRAKHHRRR